MVIGEMTGDLPCNEDLYEAGNASVFADLNSAVDEPPDRSLYDLVSTLLHNELPEPASVHKDHFTVHHLNYALLGKNAYFHINHLLKASNSFTVCSFYCKNQLSWFY